MFTEQMNEYLKRVRALYQVRETSGSHLNIWWRKVRGDVSGKIDIL